MLGIYISGHPLEKIREQIIASTNISSMQMHEFDNKELEENLREKEEELKVDADKLQNPDYIARYAREKYLYSKEGEFILQIPEE